MAPAAIYRSIARVGATESARRILAVTLVLALASVSAVMAQRLTEPARRVIAPEVRTAVAVAATAQPAVTWAETAQALSFVPPPVMPVDGLHFGAPAVSTLRWRPPIAPSPSPEEQVGAIRAAAPMIEIAEPTRPRATAEAPRRQPARSWREQRTGPSAPRRSWTGGDAAPRRTEVANHRDD